MGVRQSVVLVSSSLVIPARWLALKVHRRTDEDDTAAERRHGVRCVAVDSMGQGSAAAWARVGDGPLKILVGWATMHLSPPIIGLHVR